MDSPNTAEFAGEVSASDAEVISQAPETIVADANLPEICTPNARANSAVMMAAVACAATALKPPPVPAASVSRSLVNLTVRISSAAVMVVPAAVASVRKGFRVTKVVAST